MDYKSVVNIMASSMGEKVLHAFDLANDVHMGQLRKSGEPYITHPVIVAKLLFDIGADKDTVCAALLHDTLEDTNSQQELEETIHREFGDHVLYMVQALSKNQTINNKVEQQHEYMEQIEKAFETDIGVFFIKIADLLHNMKTVISLSPERKAKWVKELKYEYLPLFSEYFHRIPLTYKSLYEQMLSNIQNVIDSYEEHSA